MVKCVPKDGNSMYVARFSRGGMRWTVTLLEKRWSEQMMTNEAAEISRKRFFLYSSASRWVNKEICKHLFTRHELEITNG